MSESTNPGIDPMSAAVPSTTQTTETPTHIDLGDDSLVRIPGQDKPVKFGEWHRGFQSNYTKTSQAKAKLENELGQLRARLEERDRFDKFRSQATQQAANSAPNKRQALISAIKELPYLDGASAAESLGAIVSELDGYDSAFQKRDLALLALAKQFQGVQGQLKSLTERNTHSDFEGKIGRWLKEGGYPDDAKDLASEIYLAYEGDDLDAEFPRIFKSRWEQLQKLFRSNEQQRVAQARQQKNPFIPGKGVNGVAGKRLDTSRMSAAEIADALFDSVRED